MEQKIDTKRAKVSKICHEAPPFSGSYQFWVKVQVEGGG